MKLSDIVNQLRLVLPKYTSLFGDNLSVSSILASGGVATITTSVAHGLGSGTNIVLKDVESQTAINSVSQDGLIFTFTTTTDHDLTLNWPEHDYITLKDFTDGAWNGYFKLTSVPNRRTFKVQSSNSLPTLNGNEYLAEVRIDGVNGRYSISVIDPTTISISGDFEDGDYQSGNISTAQRIAGSVTELRAFEQYTEKGLNDLWMFVIMGEASVSKDRSTYSDAVSTKPTGNDMRLRLIDGFSIFIIKNTSQDITANEAVDICRHTLLLPILRSINGIRFDTGLSYDGDFRTVLTGHSIFDYNRAILIYRYEFETVMDLTDDDTVQPEDTRAFRDIDYSLIVGGDDTEDMTITNLDLDEEELP